MDKDEAQARLKETEKESRVGVYRHYKGGMYVMYSASLNESDLTPVFHYYSLTKKMRWTRTRVGFTETLANGEPRFKFVRAATTKELLLACGLENHFNVDDYR